MFIVIEGPNGSGKTTLINNLSKKGCKTLSSPNGTPLAKMLRPACRGTGEWADLDPTIKFMLFSAARYDEYVRLVHGKKENVVVDRWWTSTYVYQCQLEGVGVDFLENTIHPEEKIDLVVCLTGDKDTLVKRMEEERAKNPTHGLCTWTQDRKKFEKIIDLYDSLPIYLFEKDIRSLVIDTTDMDENEVMEVVWEEIGKIKFEMEAFGS